MKKYTIIQGYIATHDKDPFLGEIKISKKTGLIYSVSKIKNKTDEADYFYDENNLIFAGMGDVHIHAREDQTKKQNYKEDYNTAASAALNGGCVHVCAMPNTPKPLTAKSDLRWHRNKIKKMNNSVTILNYVGIDAKTKPLGKPGEHFYKLYFGKSVGDLSVIYAGELDKILSRYRNHYISFHVEYEPIVQANSDKQTHSQRRPRESVTEGLRLLLPLIKKYNIKAKLCHWPVGQDSFHIIKEYKNNGAKIELEVSPLHLLFDTTMTNKNPELWTKIQMNPAIQTKKDRLDLIEGLKSGFIQYLATDHAPHTKEEKFLAFAKFKDKYKGKSNVEIAEIIKSKDKKLYENICKQNNTSGAPWLDTYGLVCNYLMVEHNFDPKIIARIASYNPGRFVNTFLKKQVSWQNYGKGFGEIKKGFVGSLTILNTKGYTKVEEKMLKTKVAWSPLVGMKMPGKVEAVFVFGIKVR